MNGYEKICKHNNCNNEVGRKAAKGYCGMHYQRYRKYGDADFVKPSGQKKVRGTLPCGVITCDKKLLQKGYCAAHYMKWYRYGDPLVSKMKPGRGRTPTVVSWAGMKQRCSNPNDPSKRRYMDRGIKYDPSWELFDNFLKDMGERPEGTTLDRIDNDGHYTKHNCRWATPSQQMNNTSTNRYLEHKGKRQTHTQWSRETGIPVNIIRWRHNKGWDIKDVLEKPIRVKRKDSLLQG